MRILKGKGGAVIKCESAQEQADFLAFTSYCKLYGDSPNRHNKRRLKSAWIKVERAAKEPLEVSMGIARREIFPAS